MSPAEYERIASEGLAVLAENQVQGSKIFRWLDPADEILREASQGNFDLIVMGHRGATSSIQRDQGLLGSVAIKVINHASCSVMIVRQSLNS